MNKHLRKRQLGITLMGLIFVGGVVGFIGLIAMQAIPSFSEYVAIKKNLRVIVGRNFATVTEIKTQFDGYKHLDDIKSISAKDLVITKTNSKTVISFEYNKEIPVIEPVYVLIKYRGSTAD